MNFEEEYKQVHNHAVIAAIGSYILDILSCDEIDFSEIILAEVNCFRKEFNPNNVSDELESNLIGETDLTISGFLVPD